MVSTDNSASKAASALEERSRELFDSSVERLDARTRSRLNQARQRALNEIKKGSTRRYWLAAPIGGLAAVALVALILVRGGGETGAPQLENGGLPLDDFEIVADGDTFEMIRDAEFYSWLPQSQSGTADPTG